ncbi:MAG: hypothetical protein ACTIDN_11130 [Acetobacter sp.]|uniref:hypothetical protein n=1 Tax=Acetobacter sp. TaxID=440 RepID=UPI003F8E6D26
MVIDEIKMQLRQQLEGPVLEVCLNVVDHLSDISFEQAQRLTFNRLYAWAGDNIEEFNFYAALSVLTSMKNHPLIMYFVFYDQNEDREIAISVKTALCAVKNKEFFDPETGIQIEDFEKKLFPVYKMSRSFTIAAKKR